MWLQLEFWKNRSSNVVSLKAWENDRKFYISKSISKVLWGNIILEHYFLVILLSIGEHLRGVTRFSPWGGDGFLSAPKEVPSVSAWAPGAGKCFVVQLAFLPRRTETGRDSTQGTLLVPKAGMLCLVAHVCPWAALSCHTACSWNQWYEVNHPCMRIHSA